MRSRFAENHGEAPGSLYSEKVIRALRKRGFRYAPKRGKGSHIALTGSDASGRVRLVIVPKKGELPVGTLHSILEQAGLDRSEFLKLL